MTSFLAVSLWSQSLPQLLCWALVWLVWVLPAAVAKHNPSTTALLDFSLKRPVNLAGLSHFGHFR
jgi:hypothetical protein